MKQGIYFLLFIGLLLLARCTDEGPSALYPDAEVDQFMDQLIAGSYSNWELPEFGPDKIPALLEFADDSTSVSVFPRNGLSSFYQTKCSLGMLALWTVESIRVRDLASTPRGFGRFPSLNPALALRASYELELVFDNAAQLSASEAYRKWWLSALIMDNDFEILRKIDPLDGTPYRWH